MMAKSQLAKLKNAVQNGENADDSATDNVPNEFDHVGSRPPDGHSYLVP